MILKLAIADFLQDNPTKSVKDIIIACYGLAFKPDIDDLRESPALDITKRIASTHSGLTLAVEPNVKSISIETVQLTDINKAFAVADIHVLLVDHKEFKGLKPASGVLVDIKGIWL